MDQNRWDQARLEMAAADAGRRPAVRTWTSPTFWAIVFVVVIGVLTLFSVGLWSENANLYFLWPAMVLVFGLLACGVRPHRSGAIALGQAVGMLLTLFIMIPLKASRTAPDTDFSFVVGSVMLTLMLSLGGDLLIWLIARAAEPRDPRTDSENLTAK